MSALTAAQVKALSAIAALDDSQYAFIATDKVSSRGNVNIHPSTANALLRKGLATEVGAQDTRDVRSGQFGRGWSVQSYVARGHLKLTDAGRAAVSVSAV